MTGTGTRTRRACDIAFSASHNCHARFDSSFTSTTGTPRHCDRHFAFVLTAVMARIRSWKRRSQRERHRCCVSALITPQNESSVSSN
jgi:hypothetical protein